MKKLLSLIILAMLSIGMLAYVPITKAAPPTMYADPATKTLDYPVWPGTNPKWNFSVMVNNLTNCLTVSCSVKSQNNTAAIVTNYYKGAYITAQGLSWLIGEWDSVNGDVKDLTAYSSDQFTISTPQEIFKIEVEGKAFTDAGGVIVDIYAQYAGDVDNIDLLTGDCPNDHTVYLNKVIQVIQPTAAFTWLPVTVYDGDLVTFDATASTGGFDGNDVTNITAYEWDFGAGPANLTVNPTFTFSPDGSYPVNLTIYTDISGSPDPSYSQTAFVTHTVTVYAILAGRDIDLYTANWRYGDDNTTYPTPYTGEEPTYPNGAQVDSYGPQDLVCLYAKLTYNGEPIVLKEVAFEVHGPSNQYQNIILWRQTFTNGSGIAEFCFRIPWPDLHAEDIVFGEWSALAKASVANQEVWDSHWWIVHWIVDIESETVTPNPVYELGTLEVNVTVKNWAMTPRNFTYTATLYDELQVPVGAAYLDVNDAPPGVSGPYSVTIFVPEWAYVGMGTVYKNLFTRLPWLCGICWCPEYSEIVVIKATDPHIPPF